MPGGEAAGAPGAPSTGDFLKVACPDCSHKQIVFARASTTVACVTCGRVIAEPTGGLARLAGEIVDRL